MQSSFTLPALCCIRTRKGRHSYRPSSDAFPGNPAVTTHLWLQLGLRVMRGAVWTAVLTMSAVKTRHACYSTADVFINTILQLKGRYRPARRKLSAEGGNISSVDAHLKNVNGPPLCSVDVAAGGAGLMATSSDAAEQV